MGAALSTNRDAMGKVRDFEGREDFAWYISPHMWTKLASDTNTAVAQAGTTTCGILSITTPATSSDNDEAANYMTGKNFLFAANKPIVVETFQQFTEANTSAANVAFGLASISTLTDLIADNGTGPAASFSGALIYKVDGGTVWRCVSSVGTTQTISVSTTTAGGSAYQRLRIEVLPYTSTQNQVLFFVDDVQLIDATSGKPIAHIVAVSGAAAMTLGNYLKCGSTTGETLLVDDVSWSAKR